MISVGFGVSLGTSFAAAAVSALDLSNATYSAAARFPRLRRRQAISISVDMTSPKVR